MRKILFLIIFCLLVGATSLVSAQVDGRMLLPADSLKGEDRVIEHFRNWKYHAGDNSAWADPEFDDSLWETVDTRLKSDKLPKDGWRGIGWFRLHVAVDSTLWNKPLALIYHQTGAAEIYLDGKLIYTFGKVGTSKAEEEGHHSLGVLDPPKLISFDGRPLSWPSTSPSERPRSAEHVIAVRYSNFRAETFNKTVYDPAGFSIGLGELENSLEHSGLWVRRLAAYQMFFSGVPLAFTLLHLLLFLFYPRSRENLYYAALTASITALTFTGYEGIFLRDSEQLLFNFWLFKVAVLLTCVSGVRFLYKLFYPKLPRPFWVLLAGGIVLGGWSWYTPILYIYLFALVTFVEMLRVIFVAVLKKKDGAWIIGIGGVAFIFACTYQILIELEVLKAISDEIYVYGTLCFLISMSVYLARSFARTNKDLEAQLMQVKELSAKTIEQERLAKEEEMARKIVEADNARKTQELEEARKLQKVLSELEDANVHLRETQSQLVESEKMAALGDLVAGVAHEINTPVGAIKSMHDTSMRAMEKLKRTLEVQFPKECQDNREFNAALKVIADANQVITTGSDRVTNIVKSLRSFARLGEAELKEVDIHEGIEDTLTLIYHDLKNRIKVIKHFGEIPPVVCYPRRLNQVFLNILVNAKQAVEVTGEISITTFQKDHKVHVAIRDNGVGIPEENLEKVFDPGFTTKGVRVGTGLGLSICYQIIRDRKGEIKVESRVGEGSTFTVMLPMDLDEEI